MEQPYRLRIGGRVNRHRAVRFVHDGRGYTGFEGDTLASALIANGVHLVGRSLKYRRPRGIMGVGAEDPNALVKLWQEPRTEPMARITQVDLAQGLKSEGLRGFPSVKRDLGAWSRGLIGTLPGLLTAGFVYKGFTGSRFLWKWLWEPFVRRASGWGRCPEDPDPDAYVHRHAHCDVLIVGGGPAGLRAARTAAQADPSIQVMLLEDHAELGGSLLSMNRQIDGLPAAEAVDLWIAELAGLPNLRILTRTTAQSLHNPITAAGDPNQETGKHRILAEERLADHHPDHSWLGPRRRLWHIQAKRVILATGALERPLVFPDNDRPGIMTASAAMTYVVRYAAVPGRRAVLFTNNDSAYETVTALHGVGVRVEAVVDSRAHPDGPIIDMVRALSIPVLAGYVVTGTEGRQRLEGVEIMRLSADGDTVETPMRLLECDLLCVSGGWTPQLQLHAQRGGQIGWSDAIAAPIPVLDPESPDGSTTIGAAAGVFALLDCLKAGDTAAAAAATALGHGPVDPGPCPQPAEKDGVALTPLWSVPTPPDDPRAAFRSFVDFQSDTTVADLQQAVADGFVTMEHVKRYATVGLGTDQGRMGSVNAMGILACLLDRAPDTLTLTSQRPPYTPLTLGSLAGRHIGPWRTPERRSPLWQKQSALGAVFEPVDQHRIAWVYPRIVEPPPQTPASPSATPSSTSAPPPEKDPKPPERESEAGAMAREIRAVRSGCGVYDACPVGKILVTGARAGSFLSHAVSTRIADLPVGRLRDGVFCESRGYVLDIGLIAHVSERHWVITTATDTIDDVLARLDSLRDEFAHADGVCITDATELIGILTLSGPSATSHLSGLCDPDTAAALATALPGRVIDGSWTPSGSGDGTTDGIDLQIWRHGASGEITYDIHMPPEHIAAFWQALMDRTPPPTPVGQGAWDVLKAQKGRVRIRTDLDGPITPTALGYGERLITPPPTPPAVDPTDGIHVGGDWVRLVPEDAEKPLPEIGCLILDPDQTPRGRPKGSKQPTSSVVGQLCAVYGPPLSKDPVLLARVEQGRANIGARRTLATTPPQTALLADPVSYDPSGERSRG